MSLYRERNSRFFPEGTLLEMVIDDGTNMSGYAPVGTRGNNLYTNQEDCVKDMGLYPWEYLTDDEVVKIEENV